MKSLTVGITKNDQDFLFVDVSDAALEAAAADMPGAAISFANAPTVSVLVVCCSNDGRPGQASRGQG